MAAAPSLFGIGAPAGVALFDVAFRAPAAPQPPMVRPFAPSVGLTQFFSGAGATPAARSVNRCCQCNGHFGLVRYRHFGKQFCSDAGRNRCRQRYLAHHAHELSVRLRNIGVMVAGLFRNNSFNMD
jgi:hypothetical protein